MKLTITEQSSLTDWRFENLKEYIKEKLSFLRKEAKDLGGWSAQAYGQAVILDRIIEKIEKIESDYEEYLTTEENNEENDEMDYTDYDITFLKNKIITEIKEEGDSLTFRTAQGDLKMYHEKDCCESVYIESIVGDLKDLVGHPVLVAEESTNSDLPPIVDDQEEETECGERSYTWTFYKLATIKGYVDIRWYGESNGYYSEGVDFKLINKLEEE